MNRERTIGLAAMLAGALALAATLPAMARRLREHNERADFQRFAFQRINEEEFSLLGKPARVAFVTRASPTGESAPDAVTIEWSGETVTIPAGGRSEARLPGLLKVDDWLQVLQMRELERGASGVAPKPDGTRVIVVARRPAPGADDSRYVNRKGWLYEVVELRRPDSAAQGALPAPSPVVRAGRKDPAPLVSDFTQTDAFARWTINFAALPNYERTWQYAAALAVTPRLSYPRNKFTDDGLAAMSWTWPAAGFGVLGVVVGGALVASSRVRRDGSRLRPATPLGV